MRTVAGFAFILLLVAFVAVGQVVAAEVSAGATARTNNLGQWTVGSVCVAGQGSGCCCPARQFTPVIKTTIKRSTVSRKVTVTVTKHVATATRTMTKSATLAAAARRFLERDARIDATTELLEINEPFASYNDDGAISSHDLFPRHICPICPTGVALGKNNNGASGSQVCCPARKTVTSTKTRFATKVVKKTKTVTVRGVVTKTATVFVQTINGRLYYDLNNDGSYTPGIDQPLANMPIVLVTNPTHRQLFIKKRATGSPNVLSQNLTSSQGEYVFNVIGVFAGQTVWVAKESDPMTVLQDATAALNGNVPYMGKPLGGGGSSAITTAVTTTGAVPLATTGAPGVTTKAPGQTTAAAGQTTTVAAPAGTTTVAVSTTMLTTTQAATMTNTETTKTPIPQLVAVLRGDYSLAGYGRIDRYDYVTKQYYDTLNSTWSSPPRAFCVSPTDHSYYVVQGNKIHHIADNGTLYSGTWASVTFGSPEGGCVVSPDGQAVYVVGYSPDFSGYTMWQINASDPVVGGVVTPKFVIYSSRAYQPRQFDDQGRLYLAFDRNLNVDDLHYIRRLLPLPENNGTLDTTWAGTGEMNLTGTFKNYLSLMVVPGADRLVMSAQISDPSRLPNFLQGYHLDGSVDTSYGTSGQVQVNITRFITAMADDGTVLVLPEAQSSAVPITSYDIDGNSLGEWMSSSVDLKYAVDIHIIPKTLP